MPTNNAGPIVFREHIEALIKINSIVMDVLRKGALAGKRRWERGDVPIIENIDHAIVHLAEYRALITGDKNADLSEDHLAHAATRLIMALATERRALPPSSNRPIRKPEC